MSDPTPVPAPTAPGHRAPGYFNHDQLVAIQDGEDILEVANRPAHDALVTKNKLTTTWLTNYGTLLQTARAKTTATGQDKDDTGASVLHATGTELALITHLQEIQASRKLQRRLGEMEEPVVVYPLDGYLIGARLNPSRALLLQNADALIVKATNDNLPGMDTAAIQGVKDALTAYRNDRSQQKADEEIQEQDRRDRDKLVRKITAGRLAIQHAADGVWPYTNPDNAAIRNAFELPLNRSMN